MSLTPRRAAALALALSALLAACAPAAPATPAPATPPPAPETSPPRAAPTPEPTVTPAGCREPHGRIARDVIHTHLQPDPLEIRVYLPPCYSEAPDNPYPVLVIIHGQTYNDDQWDRLGIDEAADALIAAGQSRPFLIFMPLERRTEREPEDSNFDVVVAEALLPWIDASYPTCTERACRAVGGLSRGATWSVYLGLLRPGLFGAIGAHSLTPFFGDVYRLPYWMMRVSVDELPRFYLDMGYDDHHMQAVTEFRQAMTDAGIAYEWHDGPGAHDEQYWRQHVEDYVRWYAAGWPALP